MRPPPKGPGDVEAFTLSEDPIKLKLRSGGRAGLSLAQQFVVVKTEDPDRGPWKVSTLGYWYRLEDDAGKEIIAWHWHPLGQSSFGTPHLHVGAPRLSNLHVPCERVSMESVIRFLITEFDVKPTRRDWEGVLDRAERAFRQWRTWPGASSSS